MTGFGSMIVMGGQQASVRPVQYCTHCGQARIVPIRGGSGSSLSYTTGRWQGYFVALKKAAYMPTYIGGGALCMRGGEHK